MTASISTERLFSLSCFEGLRLLRRYMAMHPSLPVPELLQIIDSVEADARSLDMEASVYLSEIVDHDCPLDGHLFYQNCIKGVLLRHQPIWAKQMREGRARFVRRLDPNDQDVFKAAGLLKDPTPRHVVRWWDMVSGFTRLVVDQEKMEQGREAELLTLAYERKRLSTEGIDREPEWPGFDDNWAGYDVLSYDRSPSGIVNKLIEVKSTKRSPMGFIVTKHEWQQAQRAGDRYVFHIWDMNEDPPKLYIRTVAEVKPHIPENKGKGLWSIAEIPVLNH
ncbi:DUF3883 domain-containing protein [Rhodobacterales bacterium HKCCE4037]|nr:DUF3883 domain-containing protein [Rhodobacterales bacterium HKCCE4037]